VDVGGPGLGRTSVVAGLGAALTLGAVLLLVGPLRSVDVASGSLELPWWGLLPLFALTELVVASVQVRRESMSISFAEVPLVLGLAFCEPLGFVLASVLGSALGLLHHRQRGLKFFLNISLFAFEAALAQVIYHAVLAGGDVADVRGFLAAVATIIATQMVSAVVLTLVIWVMVGEYDDGVLREAMTSALVAAVANSSVGLLVVLLLTDRPSGLVLLGVVVAALVLVYQGYSRLSRGAARTESLYRFTDRLDGAVHTDAVVEAVLREARDVLTAECAELVLLPTETDPGTRLVLTDHEVVRGPALPGTPWWAEARAGRPVLLSRRDEGTGDVRDGMAAPLKVDDVVVGVLAVSDRPHHLDTFGAVDLRLFTTLANHAALALHKADLVDRLAAEAALQEHRSLHDALTGLPNWRRFQQVVDAALADGTGAAVAMLDLSGFKDINEAFGHGTGDALLVEVGRRLADSVGADAVARLGNDEFAVLLPAPDAAAAARALVELLSEPFTVHGLDVHVRAVAGVSWAPTHGEDAATLLQHADTALYAAKDRQSDVEVYEPAADGAATRLLMTGHLRDAIAAGGLEVHYQPKIDPATGSPVGAEALVRWEHPAHGQVSPEEFVRLAEHANLILPLTRFVLATALRASAEWRQAGADLGVAVNLSARSLTDGALPAIVGEALAAAGLPGAALTLEITETAVMGDLNRSLAVLHELRALGVHLSVDDFGTGQSSLSYLQRLPIHEMKIDKSFVLHLADQHADSQIVRAAIELGHALGLRVVAEGVEDALSQELLADWGCDVVQGFHIARPQPIEDLRRWLGRNPTSAIPRPRVHREAVTSSSARTIGTPGR
jgi:diguanylate cyclase (GGDEF)-like protein